MRLLVAVLLLLCAAIVWPAHSLAQAYGLTQRPNVTGYLNGVMPPQPPALGTNWSTTPAFPNLTFYNPMGITQMPGQNRMVVWEREGRVYFFTKAAATATKTLMLDVSNQCQGWDDSGLMNVAFHPKFDLSGAPGTNRYVFLYYTYVLPVAQGGTGVLGDANNRPPTGMAVRDRLARFTLDANGVAVPGSETVFIDQSGTSVWHNGGGMFFHPDNGFLYVTDGDDTNDANSQTITNGLFSGVWRIDVDQRGGTISHPAPRTPTNATVANYYIPNDNPFVGVANANEEFFAIGLRSPHRMTIDPVTKRIFIGDVGAGSREEIDAIEPNETTGVNMQWSRIEGLGGDLVPPYVGVNKRPILDYGHNEGSAVIGGYVYRGTEFAAELGGKYIFGDNITNLIYVMDESTTPAGKIVLAQLPKGPGPNSGSDYTGLSSFGTDASGELYLCQLSSTGGQIFKLQRGGAASQPLPATLSATGVFANTAALTPSEKILPYNLLHPFWSDGAIKSRWAAIPTTGNVGFTSTGEWTWPEGTVFVKHFELATDDNNPATHKRLETRLLVKMASGTVYGATYKWRADNSDADLLDSSLTENVPIAITPLGALTGADIGSPALAGSTARVGDKVTITAGGTDIWDNADQFHFAYQQRTGDFDVSVRIESLAQADLYTKAGLMARESLVPGSRHVMALIFPSNAARNNNDGGYEFGYRAATNGASAAVYPPVPNPHIFFPNGWLRLKRQGDTFIAYASTDGAVWSEYARYTLVLPQTLYFGLAVTAHAASPSTTAVFNLQTTRLQPWYYPSRENCATCHNTNAGGFLGPKARQLNGNLLYPGGVTDNQLRAWAHVGLFDNAPTDAQLPSITKLAVLNDTNDTLERRARSYLDANCSNCHRPGGVPAFWDARFDTPLAQQGILYGVLTNSLGDPTARVVVPQDLARSVMHRRINVVGGIQMPPLARNQIDTQGADVMAQWIASLAPNTPPTVALTAPNDGLAVQEGTPIALAANAADTDGIQRVEFYDGLTKLGEDTTVPYQLTWNGASRGTHQVSAIAVDTVGNSTQSSTVSVLVQALPLPGGWLHSDVGTPDLAGDVVYTPGSYAVSASGNDIWDNADAFHFVYRTLTGDGELIARVASLENTDGWAKAGVMMRETLTAGSKHAFSAIAATQGDAFQRRTTTNGGSTHTPGPGAVAPFWVRLVRSGDVFTAYSSPDGVAWRLIGSDTIPMATTIYAGLAVTSHNNTTLNHAVLDHVQMVGGALTFSTKVNFQPAGAALPVGYLADTGALYAPASGGFSYGWSRDNTADARDRNSVNAPDQRYDTLEQFQVTHSGGGATSFWEIGVPNGQYQVRIVAGDPDNVGDTHHLLAEGQTLLNATTSAATRFVEATGVVTVTDGRLTIAPGASAVNAKICFVEIASFDSNVNQLPSLTLTAPANGASLVDVPAVHLTATASDGDGTVALVEFFVDNVKVGEAASAPYQVDWLSSGYGSHTVTARATDNLGGVTVSSASTITVANSGAAGFLAEYYDTIDLSGPALTRVDANINFDWGTGSPDPAIGVDTFSARWRGRVRPRYTGTYTFTVEADDGVRLWINGNLVINQWIDQGPTRYSTTLPVVADQGYDIVMEYYEDGSGAVARLLWSSSQQGEEAIPDTRVTAPTLTNQPPTVALTWPLNGASILDRDTVGLTAIASDPDGYIARVEFWANGVKLGEDTTAPYSFNWPGTHAVGTHSIYAKAFDLSGLSATTPVNSVLATTFSLTPAQVQHLIGPERMVSTLQFTIPAGRAYVVEWSEDLANWYPISTGTSTGSQVQVVDTAIGVLKRFFRLRLTN